MDLPTFIARLTNAPKSIQFTDTMAVIEAHYLFTPTAFDNGSLHNEAGQNSGSCKLFSFAKRHNLSKEATLECFGDYYRKDVLEQPEGTDHQNIRQFMALGWEAIQFSGEALTPKI